MDSRVQRTYLVHCSLVDHLGIAFVFSYTVTNTRIIPYQIQATKRGEFVQFEYTGRGHYFEHYKETLRWKVTNPR